MSGELRTCAECGDSFILSYEEQRYFRERHLELPKRCKKCRSRRRSERESGMRGFSGPPVQVPAHMMPDSKSASHAPNKSTPLILWHDLSKSNQYHYMSKFAHLDVSTIPALPIADAALLLQWAFEQNGLEAYTAEAAEKRVDLKMMNREYDWNEFARIYLDQRDIPVNAVWQLLKDLEDTYFKRIHFCTIGTFSDVQKQLSREFSTALQIVEGAQLRQYVSEAQQRFRTRLEQRSTPRAHPVQPKSSWWKNFKRRVRAWLGFRT